MRRRFLFWYQRLRIVKYWLLSDCAHVNGNPVLRQPVQLVGTGSISFNGEVNLGYYPSPFALSGYIYIEARTPDSMIEMGDGVWVNNNAVFISNGPGITIGPHTLFGTHCEIIDSDFHNTNPDKRMDSKSSPSEARVVIGENVMIGSNVKICKGVRIGNNSVVANGSIVTRSIPANKLAFGNPIQCGPLLNTDLWKAQKSPCPAQ